MVKDWRDSFDEKFPPFEDERGAEGTLGTPEEIKSFIESLLTKERQELIEGLEKIKPEFKDGTQLAVGERSALRKALSLIRNR